MRLAECAQPGTAPRQAQARTQARRRTCALPAQASDPARHSGRAAGASGAPRAGAAAAAFRAWSPAVAATNAEVAGSSAGALAGSGTSPSGASRGTRTSHGLPRTHMSGALRGPTARLHGSRRGTAGPHDALLSRGCPGAHPFAEAPQTRTATAPACPPPQCLTSARRRASQPPKRWRPAAPARPDPPVCS